MSGGFIIKNVYENTVSIISVPIGDATFLVMGNNIKESSGLYTRVEKFTDIHLHTGFEIQCVLSGQMALKTELGTHNVVEKNIVLIPPKAYHSVEPTESGVCRYVIEFSLMPNSNPTKFYEYLIYNRILSRVKDVTVIKSEACFEALGKLTTLKNLNSQEQFNKIISYLSIFLIELLSELDQKTFSKNTNEDLLDVSRKDTLLIEKQKFIISNCIAGYFDTDASSEKIEKELGMSKRNAARIVYNNFGKTVSELVLEHRMKSAKVLIENTDIQLSSIAEEVGYKTYVAFFTAFKKYYGVSPTEYKENIQPHKN